MVCVVSEVLVVSSKHWHSHCFKRGWFSKSHLVVSVVLVVSVARGFQCERQTTPFLNNPLPALRRFERGVMEGCVIAFGCQCALSLCAAGLATLLSHKSDTPFGRTRLLLGGRPNCARQSLANTVPVVVVGTSSCCLGCTPRGHPTTRLLRGVLRRVLEIAFKKVLRRVLGKCLAVHFVKGWFP